MNYQVVIPVLISFVISVILGPIIIPFLRKLKMGQTERVEGVQSHTLPHTKPKTQGATAQPRIPFIRKSPDLKHQENFSKGTPHDKISVQHPAQGLSGDWQVP